MHNYHLPCPLFQYLSVVWDLDIRRGELISYLPVNSVTFVWRFCNTVSEHLNPLQMMIMLSSLCYTNTSSRILTLLAHWNNSQRVDRSLHSGILSRFRANQPFLLLLNTACWPLCCLFFFNIRILITSRWYLQALLVTLPYPHLLVYIVFLFNIYQLKNMQPLSGESRDYKIDDHVVLSVLY
jgi:hypothetical protein